MRAGIPPNPHLVFFDKPARPRDIFLRKIPEEFEPRLGSHQAPKAAAIRMPLSPPTFGM